MPFGLSLTKDYTTRSQGIGKRFSEAACSEGVRINRKLHVVAGTTKVITWNEVTEIATDSQYIVCTTPIEVKQTARSASGSDTVTFTHRADKDTMTKFGKHLMKSENYTHKRMVEGLQQAFSRLNQEDFLIDTTMLQDPSSRFNQENGLPDTRDPKLLQFTNEGHWIEDRMWLKDLYRGDPAFDRHKRRPRFLIKTSVKNGDTDWCG